MTANGGNAMNESLFAQLVAIGAARNIEVTYEDVPGQTPRKRLGYVLTAGSGSYECYGYHLGPVTDEVLTDLIAYFENVEDVMNIYSTDLFKYLAGDMIGNRQVVLTITRVTVEKLGRGKEEEMKPCLHFAERNKMLVLNKTNAKVLAAALGPETDLWVGGSVTIAAPMIEAFGKQTRSLKIVNVQPAATAAKPRNGTATQQPPAPTYADGSSVAESALAGYRDYLAANDNRPPADVRELIAWQKGDGSADLFGTQTSLVTVDATQPGREYQD
jgi:hypothetical protein